MSEERTHKELVEIFENMELTFPSMLKLMLNGKLNYIFKDYAYSLGLLNEDFSTKPEVTEFLKIWGTPEYYKIVTQLKKDGISTEELERIFKLLEKYNPWLIGQLKSLGRLNWSNTGDAKDLGLLDENGKILPEVIELAKKWDLPDKYWKF